MIDRLPYTYLLKFTNPDNGEVKFYYGSSYGAGAHPNKLWVKYETSSSVVGDLIERYGKDVFEYEVRRVFDSVEKCLKWEKRVLVYFDVFHNPDWLNQSNNVHHYAKVKTLEHKAKLRAKSVFVHNNPSLREIPPATDRKYLHHPITQHQTMAKPEDVQSYVDKGYVYGQNDKTKKAKSEGHKGIAPWNKDKQFTEKQKEKFYTPENTEKRRNAGLLRKEEWTGSHHSQESKNIISEKVSKHWDEHPAELAMRGKKISENKERALKISKSKAGTKFMNKDGITKSVQLELVDDYVKNGWNFGLLRRQK